MSQISILLVNDSNITDENESCIEKITLPHPKGLIPIVFLLDSTKNCLYELQGVQPSKFGSWFINQKVSSQKGFFTATVIDPRFLVLPFLRKASSKFSPLDQIISNIDKCNKFPLNLLKDWKMDEICDVNDSFGEDMILYKYNEIKVHDWLRKKVDKTSNVIASKRRESIRKENSLMASSFNIEAQQQKQDNKTDLNSNQINELEKPTQEDILIAAQIVCDYVEDVLATECMTRLGLESSDLNKKASITKRKADWEGDLEVCLRRQIIFNLHIMMYLICRLKKKLRHIL